MLAFGLMIGLVSGVCHSLAYLVSRWFTVTGRGTNWELLIIVHVQLGVLAAAGLGFAWPAGLALSAAWAGPALSAAVVLMLSQACFFWVLRHVDASTLAPLMSVKMSVIALLTVVGVWGPGQAVPLLGWAGVGLAIAAAFLIQGFGRAPTSRMWVVIVAMFFGYAFCDVSIARASDVMVAQQLEAEFIAEDSPGARLHVAAFVATVVYAGTGVLALLGAPWLGTRKRQAWIVALPYTIFWAIAMVTLYAAFGTLGVVYGAILQSTRSLWSVVLGALVAHRGGHHIETKHQPHILAWRVLAAVCMVAAVALYGLASG